MEDPSQSQAQLCRNGCGFYGSSKNDGMCSICYKDYVQKKNASGKKSPSSTLANPEDVANSTNGSASQNNKVDTNIPVLTISKAEGSSMTQSSSGASVPISSPIAIPSAANPSTSLTSPSTQNYSLDDSSTSLDSTSSSPSKTKKNRCASCRKRLGLTGFYCRCGNLYCSLHRYSDQHACQFDYKADAQAKIRKENPVVVGEKINKI